MARLMMIALMTLFLFGTISAFLGKFIKKGDLNAIVSILNKDELQSHIEENEKDRILVIDFQKSNCKPCIRVAPLLKKMCEGHDADEVSFCKVDADNSENGPIALECLKEHGIKTVPTFHVYVGQTLVETVKGAYIEELEEKIESHRAVLSDKNVA